VWSTLGPPALLDKLKYWTERTLVDFARDSLKPTVFAAGSIAAIQRMLEKPLGVDGARRAAAELSMGARPDADADLPGALHEFTVERMDRARFVDLFGHRGSREMELSAPRWNEDGATLTQVLATAGLASNHDDGSKALERIAAEAKL